MRLNDQILFISYTEKRLNDKLFNEHGFFLGLMGWLAETIISNHLFYIEHLKNLNIA